MVLEIVRDMNLRQNEEGSKKQTKLLQNVSSKNQLQMIGKPSN